MMEAICLHTGDGDDDDGGGGGSCSWEELAEDILDSKLPNILLIITALHTCKHCKIINYGCKSVSKILYISGRLPRIYYENSLYNIILFTYWTILVVHRL